VGHRFLEVDQPVTLLLPVLERPGPQLELAGAVRAIERRERALLQAGGGDDDLEDRARRVLGLQGPV
jgi:hypothetical protein